MSNYDYNFPESLRIAEINNNRKVGTVQRKFIQSGNNVASGFARPEPYPLGSPAMGGAMSAVSGGGAMSAASGGKFNLGKVFKKVGKVAKSVGESAVKVAAPVVTKLAQQHLEKALTSMLQSSAESGAVGAGITGGKRGARKYAKEMMAHPDTKKMIAEAVQSLTPVVQNVADSMVGGRKFNIGRAFKSVGRSIGKVAANIAPTVLPMAFEALATATGNPELAIPAAAIGSQTGDALKKKYGSGRPRGRPRKALALAVEAASASMPRAIGGSKSGGSKSGGSKSGGSKSGGASRQSIVSKIMKERGCSLPQASSIVKSEGLY